MTLVMKEAYLKSLLSGVRGYWVRSSDELHQIRQWDFQFFPEDEEEKGVKALD